MENTDTRVVRRNLRWHNAGGYKLSAYIGAYYPDRLWQQPDKSYVWVGGAKNDKYIFLSQVSGRWMITDCKSKVNDSIGCLRAVGGDEHSVPPVGLIWEVWDADHGMWSSDLWSEKGSVSMDGFVLELN